MLGFYFLLYSFVIQFLFGLKSWQIKEMCIFFNSLILNYNLFFTFLSPYFIYFNYNLLTGNANKDLSREVSIFILVLAILAPIYPSFMYYSDLDTLKAQHSEYYCGTELKIGRSMPLLERFSFNKQCEK